MRRINILGDSAVFRNYAWGLATHHGNVNALWKGAVRKGCGLFLMEICTWLPWASLSLAPSCDSYWTWEQER